MKKEDVNSQFSPRILNPEDDVLKGREHPAALLPAFDKIGFFPVVTKSNLGAFKFMFVLWLLGNLKNLPLKR